MQIQTIQDMTIKLTTTMSGWPLINGMRVGSITLRNGVLHMTVQDRTYLIALQDYLEQVGGRELSLAC
jgi:hypothetical protein